MGIDFSGCSAHWSYGGFHAFRERLAAAIGIDLNQMHGFGPRRHNADTPFADIPWDTVQDAIVPLLNHSDCDGELTPEQCRTIAPRLRELVAGWRADDYDRIQALLLVKGMKRAAARGVSLEFE